MLSVGGPVISVLFLFLLRIKELRTKRPSQPGTVREKLTLRLFLLTGILMITGSLTEFLWRGGNLRWTAFIAGWSLALLSFVLRRWAITTLGRYWSLHVEIRQNHRLIKAGPFRWLRHPTYLSMALELFAGGLILNAVYTSAVIFPLFVAILIYRLRLEETALVEKFGDAYRTYQRETPALFPYKWPTIKKI